MEKGDYDVTDIYGMDEKTGDVYFQAAMLNPHDRQVYVAHKNGKVERLTDKEGSNSAYFSGDYRYFVNTWSSYSHPQVFTVCNSRGKVIKTLEDNKELLEKTQQYNWGKRETFTFTTSEGVKLDGWMVKPLDFDANKKYPVILFQYSGPGNQQVLNAWNTGSMGQGGAFDYYLAQEGFIVVCVDGRGTGGRGADFEKCTYLRLGDLESKDQVETAIYMSTLPYVDKDNIGIWGWSFGGFNTLMSMSEGRPVFKAGVAVAPPTSWRFYDTIYTERYMRTPQEDEEDEKILVRELVRKQASPEDFETLFKFQGEHKMWEAEIARTDEYERHGDPFFANWVDSVKLEEKLKFWIKGNITSQQSWYIVWCLMKYTFHMVRDNQDKAAFAARMNLMFPDAEKKCVVESFRKQETQKNHNHHFSEWLEGSDPDYHTAQDLYYKLAKRDEYMRSI